MDVPQKPSQEILSAFMIRDEPVLLKGGQGTTWRAGDSVIKPIESEEETVWCAETIESLPQEQFRIARYKKTRDNTWVYNGWAVLEFIAGVHAPHRWEEKVQVCKAFNSLLQGISKPDFIEKRTNPWAIAGKMAWEELSIDYDPRLQSYIDTVQKYLHPISVTEQIVHGDITGNMLFKKELPPGIIDFTPTWRAKEYALAILIVDALTWEGADDSIFSLVKDEENIFQYLLRAALFRMLVVSEFKRQFHVDRLSEVTQHEKTLELIIHNFT